VNLYQAVSELPVVANMVGMLCPLWIAKSYSSIDFFGDGCCAFAEGS
jgi:hypothetical protein